MGDIRPLNKRCITCGNREPLSVQRIEEGSYVRFECPDCGWNILNGIISDGHPPANSPARPPQPLRNFMVPDSAEIRSMEGWWTDNAAVGTINGNYAMGDKQLLGFVEKIKYIYERS